MMDQLEYSCDQKVCFWLAPQMRLVDSVCQVECDHRFIVLEMSQWTLVTQVTWWHTIWLHVILLFNTGSPNKIGFLDFGPPKNLFKHQKDINDSFLGSQYQSIAILQFQQ